MATCRGVLLCSIQYHDNHVEGQHGYGYVVLNTISHHTSPTGHIVNQGNMQEELKNQWGEPYTF